MVITAMNAPHNTYDKMTIEGKFCVILFSIPETSYYIPKGSVWLGNGAEVMPAINMPRFRAR
jgi:hypothetical protein